MGFLRLESFVFELHAQEISRAISYGRVVANAAQKATTHVDKTEIGAAPEAAAELVDCVEDVKILGGIHAKKE